MHSLQLALGERYALQGEVGQGAMAVVFHAHDRRFDRPVAIKMLRPELGASVSAERFRLEIETAARLQHPHIVPIYDAGSAEGLHYYVMPLVAGVSLRMHLLRERTLAWTEALRLTTQIAGALGYAHARQIVHRDIKPENILLHEGHAMVADFGIAKVLSGSGEYALTLADHSIGTPAYMSPEQAFGEKTIDGRADLYSLACTLYEMIEGRTPFSGTTIMAILVEKTTTTVRPLLSARSSVPHHVNDVLQRALAHDPSDRFGSVGQFVEALQGSAQSIAAQPQRVRSSVAVLPFTNLGNDRDDEFLSDGISEDLTHALAQISGLRVAGRTSAFTFKGRPVDAREAGTALGVDAVLDGSLRRRGDRLRIVVHLTDVHTGFELWSDRFDRQFTDMFDVQDEITRSIVGTLRVQLSASSERLVATPTANMEAYESYLRGRAAWNERTKSSMHVAREHLGRAIELDSSFALAHAGLAECFVTLALYGDMSPGAAMPAAEQAITLALNVDPDSAESLTARASVQALYHWNWEAAERDFLTAIRHGSSLSTANQWYAMHLLAPQGRLSDAARHLEAARQLDPLSLVLQASIGMVHFYARRFDTALSHFDALSAAHPRFELAAYFRAQVLTAAGRPAEAVDVLDGVLARAGDRSEVSAALGVACATLGDSGRVAQIRELLDRRARSEYVSPVLVAQMSTASGNIDDALRHLEAAAAIRAPDLTMLPLRPVFDALRETPRYNDILRRMHLPNPAEPV